MYADTTNSNYPTMKNKKLNPHKVCGPLPHLVAVRFEFTDPSATTVCVAGTFNQWQADTKTMHSSSGGHWWKETALAPGTYEYCLVVDGQWIPDPLAKESGPNQVGGRNSVLTVASPEAAHLADAENLPLKNAYEQKRRKDGHKK